MRVAQRLYLALLPAALGVVTVAALAYWGQYAHTAPDWFVVVAAAATLGTFAAAWWNLRYVTRRVERLAAHPSTAEEPVTPDELEAIEHTVRHLSTAVGQAEAERQAGQDAMLAQQHSYGELLSRATNEAMTRLDDIRLPLHILLENHFGDLNENQEEMLGSARAAAEQAGDAFQRLGQIADLDRGVVALRHDRIRPGDLIAAVLPALVAEGDERGVRVTAEITPALQSIPGDRGRLQLALELLLHDALRQTPDGNDMRLTADTAGGDVVIAATHGGGSSDSIAVALGERVIVAHGGRVHTRSDGDRRITEIALPR
ncbi:MAG: hypothetical protein ACREPM_05110 [Gemmatimonadaceae bacterium]